jgi:HK97 family phage portal protein
MRWPWQPAETKTARAFTALSGLPAVQWGSRDDGALMRDGYVGNAVCHRCVRMVAETAASIPLRAAPSDLASLLQTPSPDMSGRVLLERIYTDLQLTGNAWLEAVSLPDTPRPRGLYAWPVHAARPVRNRLGQVIGHALRTVRGDRTVLPGPDGWSSVLHLKLYHPGDPGLGLSPLAAARQALDLHNGTANWAKALLDNAARPSGALVYGREGQRLSDDQFDRLKEELNRTQSGAENAGRPLLLEGGLDWRPMSLSPTEMDFRETRHAAAREIALAFGVPPMLLGIPGDNTYANYREANLAFWRMSVLPLVVRTAETLAHWLDGRFAGASLSPDLDEVPAFAAEREALWNRIGAADFLSDAEKRRLLGLPA